MIKRFGFILALLFVVVMAGCKKTEYKLEGPTTVSIVAGESKELTLSVTPETSIKDVTFTVDKTSIVKATLNQTTLKVEGITAGSATITVTLKEKIHTIDVTVTEPEKAHEEKTILELLQGGKNDEKVIVTGVVYGIAQNGFYLEDSETGKIYVTLKTSKDLNVGDKIKLKAEYGLVGGFPRLKNAEVVETLEPVTDFGKPVIETTIKDLQTLDRTNKVGTYANVFEITGTLIKTLGGAYQLVDEEANNVLFTEISNVELFEGKESNRYAIKVVLHNFNMVSNKWEVSFVGTAEDIVEKPITLEELLPVIQSDIDTIPTHIYGNLPLPTTHPTLPFVSYSFSVETNAYMSIVDGEALFDLEALKASEATDLDIILKVNVATETEQREIDYPITLHAIKEQTLSNLLENGPEVNYSYVIVSGRVLAFSRNQTLSIRSYIVEDPLTKETTTIDFDQVGDYILHTSEDYLKVKVGDDIVVHGQYRNISRESVLNVTKVDVISSNNEVNHDIENAYVLKDEASYEELGLNYEQYLNKLVKIETPYFTYSTSTTPTQTNWVRIYHSEEPQVYDKSVNKRYFAFLIAAQSENLGNDRWMEWFDIPYVSGPAIQTEVSFYAYLLYPSATYLQFVIPSLDEILFSLEDRINNILDIQIPVSIEPGEFVDLNKQEDLVEGGITWSVSLPLIDLTTGEVADVSENTVVTLTATFNDGTKEVTLTRDITILLPKTHQVSEVVANAQDGQTIRAVGHFIGYFSDGTNTGVRGLILKDAVTSDIVFINDSSDLLGAYGQSKINDTELQIGDEVYIKGEFVVNGTPERREFIVN
ncbi:MAG: Ig-like domain-containing protein, partial [Acholeplasmataceae bacterium]